MATGEIELYAQEIEVLRAKELPLPVFGEPDYPEDIRLKYRFLDLRRETLHKNIVSAPRSSPTCAAAWSRPVSPNSRRRS